jgi:predicted DNA-binding transcriptional regulator AlpA
MQCPETPISGALLSIAEASQLLKLCEKSVWNHCCPRGDLICVRLGKRLLFRREDINAWVASRIVRPETAN